MEDVIAITVFKASLFEKGCHLLQETYYVTNIALKKLVGAKKKCGSKVAIPEVRISQNIGAVWDDGWGGRFYGVFIKGGLSEIKHLHAIAAYRLRHWGSKVKCPI